MLKKINATLVLCLLTTILFSQVKKKIDHTVYDSWNSIAALQQSKTGSLISYEINPLVGDGNLYIERIDGTLKKTFNRGKEAVFSANETCVAFLIQPQSDTIRTLKLEKAKEDKFPIDSLALYFPADDTLILFPNVKSFQLSENGNWLAYHGNKDERPICPTKKKCKLHKNKKDCIRPETSGTTLFLYNTVTHQQKTIDCVKNYLISKNGDRLVYVTSNKGQSDTLNVKVLDLRNWTSKTLLINQLSIKKMKFDFDNQQLVLLHSADTNKRKTYTLSYWEPTLNSAKLIIDTTTIGLPTNWTVSEYCSPYFSRDGNKIIVGTNEIVKQDPKDTLLDEEKAVVDVWNGSDLRIQPQQLIEMKADERKNYMGVFHISTSEFIQIEDEYLGQVQLLDHGNSNAALGFSDINYQRATTWDYPWKQDVYLINLQTGTRKLIKSENSYAISLAPSGRHTIWYEGQDSSWYAKNNKSDEIINLTKNTQALFASDANGNPFIPFSEGFAGWTKINEAEYFLVNSRYDIWALCPSNPALTFCLTNREGERDQTFYRLYQLDTDSTYLSIPTNLLIGIDDLTKEESISRLSIVQPERTSAPLYTARNELMKSNHKFILIQRSDENENYLFRKMSFTDYPEIESTDASFSNPKTLSLTNPQQNEYNWGTVEMVEWTSFEGRKLRGLLYKPEDFDSTKKYPMITYYYETYTEDIHTYYAPKPTASIVYPTEYVSNGYLMFIPDIRYTPGHPAASAYDCIVSGTDYLTHKHEWIDSTRMGLQGQSWGGYQTAQLITMTDKYKAAMAGAPVSNMFSAYGGIRWSSGLSRMFQYEKTQSRIGYTIWEKPELYIENSPLFRLNHVHTPLLIMHNDGDGAVPWYQGIELFMGLRRLDQPVWLLNYNGDGHNLMEPANRKDLSIRMRQFFDYYLLDAPMPNWMSEGVPALEKGKNFGLTPKID